MTLVEVMVALGLLSLALLLLSRLAVEYQQVIKFSNARDNVISGLDALEDIRRDGEQAYHIVSPDVGSSSGVLTLERLHRSLVNRFNVRSDNTWQTNIPEHLVTFDYRLDNGALVRQTSVPSMAARSEILADKVVGFDCNRTAEAMEVRLSLQQQERVLTYTCRVFSWTR